MEQVPVENMAPDAGMQQDDAAAQTVALPDLMNEYEQGIAGAQGAEATAPVQTNTRGSDAQPAQKVETQTDFDKVLGDRLYKERAKLTRDFESKPEYQLGRVLIQERAARDGVSAEEAARRVQAELVNSKAEEYAKDPKQFYADYLTQRQQPQQTQQPNQQETAQDSAISLSQQLLEFNAPALGFRPEHITRQFAEDAQAFGVQAALAMWQREQMHGAASQEIVSEIEQRRRVPQPIRPVGQNANGSSINYMQVSDEDWKRTRAALRQATLEGRRVKL